MTTASNAKRETIVYNDSVVRHFVAASVIWSLVALLLGVVIALQLATADANVHPYLSFGRLRPLHTNAAIFAFVGNMMFAGIYHSTQRLCKARLPSDLLAKIHFWGWQAIIVAAAITLPLGLTQGKEYAELEWPIDIAVTVVWLVFATNFFWTLARRRERHMYVALWFYIATIATVAMLHLVNSLAIPVLAFKSYSIFGGAQDALVQWWYGHNAVAFFLTTPILGIMYYYLPKAAKRPVYSYRLSIIHFWALVFIYIWAGPHHLLNTALPDWAQSLGMVFSLMLWAPSWGGMLNGLLTLRGTWQELRVDPVLKFFAAGVTFYGMATFEGPLLSIRSVSAIAHYTDWIVGHVHSGVLGWNGFMAAGMFYWMVPRLYGTKLYSRKLANQHFYLGTVGILLYTVSMWISGVTQGLMWGAVSPDGGLTYPSFVETVVAIRPLYWARMIGGLFYLAGMIMMTYNLTKTALSGKAVDGTAEVFVSTAEPEPTTWQLITGRPVILIGVTLALVFGFFAANAIQMVFFFVMMIVVGLGGTGIYFAGQRAKAGDPWHRTLEKNSLAFSALAIIAVLIGGIAEIVPALIVTPASTSEGQEPYSPLELEGRDIYIREGCYTCHSQMIRPLQAEVQRYGEVSTLEDSRFDHPFQWGSKRTGPDLAREGGKNPHVWHYKHFVDPRSLSEGSNMPSYAHFVDSKVAYADTPAKLRAMKSIGVPYAAEDIGTAQVLAKAQAETIIRDLEEQGVSVAWDSEIVAIIAYVQRLGLPPTPTATSVDAPVVADATDPPQ